MFDVPRHPLLSDMLFVEFFFDCGWPLCRHPPHDDVSNLFLGTDSLASRVSGLSFDKPLSYSVTKVSGFPGHESFHLTAESRLVGAWPLVGNRDPALNSRIRKQAIPTHPITPFENNDRNFEDLSFLGTSRPILPVQFSTGARHVNTASIGAGR